MRTAWTALIPLGIGAVMGAAALEGCGNSTGPHVPSFSEARHLDTLAQAAAAAGQFDRFRLLQYPIAVLAQGVTPDTVSLTVDDATQPYQVVALDLVATTSGTNPTPTDSLFVLVAWTGDDVSQLVYLIADPSPSLIDFALLRDTSTNFSLETESIEASLVSTAGACRTLKLATAASLMQGTCTRAMVDASFDLTFAADSAFPDTHFVLPQQAVPGVRLLMSASNGGQDFILKHVGVHGPP